MIEQYEELTYAFFVNTAISPNEEETLSHTMRINKQPLYRKHSPHTFFEEVSTD